MPTLPSNTKCSHLGCSNEKSKLNSYCLEHGGKSYDNSAERKAFNNAYQSKYWIQQRKIQLSKQPICQACIHLGKVSEAKHVDHVFPWSRIGEQAFKLNLFQSLCHECHSYKTVLEAKGIYRHYASTVVDYTENDYNYVVRVGNFS